MISSYYDRKKQPWCRTVIQCEETVLITMADSNANSALQCAAMHSLDRIERSKREEERELHLNHARVCDAILKERATLQATFDPQERHPISHVLAQCVRLDLVNSTCGRYKRYTPCDVI